MKQLKESLETLVVQTATCLPRDVQRALLEALAREEPGSRAALALRTIAVNVDESRERARPICQDTGMPTFTVKAPAGIDQLALAQAIGEAVADATRKGTLRPNSVDPITRVSSPTNLGGGTPVVHFEQCIGPDIEVELLLRGGASENVSGQYSLPCELPGLGRADRDLEGVRKCVLHAVHAAQGRGCSAGILGVGVGGDRATGYELAKAQLMRPLDDVNPEPALDRLESEIVSQANALGIGTMGFGGRVSLLGCKIGTSNRLPASFFVTVAYNCWALRRYGVALDPRTGAINRWLHWDVPRAPMFREPRGPLTGAEIPLETPLSGDAVRKLRVGDVVLLNGPVHTGRDMVHHYLMTHEPPVSLRGAAIYHCGPVALKRDHGWTIGAAGPTTSAREEPYQAEVIRRHGVRAVIGKGGMGPRTLAALEECGAVYLSAIGGAAQVYADCITRVEGVHLLEFGVPEAMWHLEVKGFPAIVTMDAHGRSLHEEVEDASARELAKLAEAALV